jgi:hypothetical protein
VPWTFLENLGPFLASQWAALTAHPVPFLLAVVIGILIAKYWYSERINVLRERLTARDEMIAWYRERFGRATEKSARPVTPEAAREEPGEDDSE